MKTQHHSAKAITLKLGLIYVYIIIFKNTNKLMKGEKIDNQSPSF